MTDHQDNIDMTPPWTQALKMCCFSSYWSTKGHDQSAFVVSFTEPVLEELGI